MLFYSTLAWSSPLADCLKIKPFVQESHQKVIAQDYPYWFGVGQAEKETRCKWKKSLDGHGSVGYFQLTPKFLDPLLRPIYPDYDKPYSTQHFYATAYYMKTLIQTSPERRLWIAYQRFNGGDWVLKECKQAGSLWWEDCKQECRRGQVCVWKVGTECKQKKSACDINYSYSVNIYQKGQVYKKKEDQSMWRFW